MNFEEVWPNVPIPIGLFSVIRVAKFKFWSPDPQSPFLDEISRDVQCVAWEPRKMHKFLAALHGMDADV